MPFFVKSTRIFKRRNCQCRVLSSDPCMASQVYSINLVLVVAHFRGKKDTPDLYMNIWLTKENDQAAEKCSSTKQIPTILVSNLLTLQLELIHGSYMYSCPISRVLCVCSRVLVDYSFSLLRQFLGNVKSIIVLDMSPTAMVKFSLNFENHMASYLCVTLPPRMSIRSFHIWAIECIIRQALPGQSSDHASDHQVLPFAVAGLSNVNLFPLSPSRFPIKYAVSWDSMPHSVNVIAQTSSALEKLRLHHYPKI